VLFDYMIAISGRFYSSALVAAIVLLPRMLMRRHLGLWLTLLWSLGVLVPHVCAVTKTPSATLLALPALTLLLSYFIFEALRGDRWLLAAIVGVAIMNLIWVAEIRPPGWSFPTSRAFGAIMRQSMWVAYHVAGSVAVLGLFGVLWLIWSLAVPEGTARRIAGRCVHASAAMFCLGVLGWLSIQSLNASWRVVNRNELDPVSVEIGAFVQTNLPENAVLFCEERKGYEHLTIMFYADRTCYPLPWTGADRQAHAVREAGGVPYLVVRRNLPLEAVHVSRGNVPTIYLWRPLEPRDNIR
jgi:hypothetical protein